MYWPARYCRRSFAGSLSFTIATSGAGLSIDSTRHGSLRIRMSPARRTSRTSITRSVSGFAQQKSARPGCFLVVGERRRLVRAVVDVALEDLSLARSAGAVAAAVRQHEVGGHRRREHGVAVGAGERMIAGLYGNLVRHGGEVDSRRWRAVQRRERRCECDPGTADWLRRRRAAHRRPAPSESPPLRAHAPRRGHSARLRAHGIVPIVGDLDQLGDASTGCARRRSRCCISRRRPPRAATIRARRS